MAEHRLCCTSRGCHNAGRLRVLFGTDTATDGVHVPTGKRHRLQARPILVRERRLLIDIFGAGMADR